jgi:hypothetical protein
MKRLKKYNRFILESSSNDFDTIGEYIEKLAEDNEYALNIISQYTKDIHSNIRLANAINLLDEFTQNLIIDLILKDKKGEEPGEAEITTHTDIDLLESNEIGGKNLFKCFLKIITALGFKNIKPNWEVTPDIFLMYFNTDFVDYNTLKSVSIRYKYFDDIINSSKDGNKYRLYYGIRNDMFFEYGLQIDDLAIKYGQFKITKSIINYLAQLTSPSSISLRMLFNDIDYDKLNLFSKIKKEMLSFNPGYTEKKSLPIITDNIITFAYYGIGKWDNGVMDIGEVENVKTNFRNYILKFKWSEKVQYSITTSEFWLKINIKVK